MVHRQAAAGRIESGQVIGLVADHRDAVGFQHLARGRQVQDGLGAGANHDHGDLRQGGQVG